MSAPPARWDAAQYHVVSTPHVAWGEKVLARLALRGDETALDVGCGTGKLTALLAERLPRGRVIALDRDPGMVAKAREHLARFGDRVECVVGDALSLPQGVADVVFSTATFHWVRDHDALFRSVFEALRPGGRLHAQCGGGANLARVLDRLSTILREPRYASWFEGAEEPWFYAGEGDTKERLHRAGFVDVEAWLEPAPARFESRDAYRRFCETVLLGQRLAPMKDEALRAEVLERLVDAASHDPEPFVLDYVRLNLGATRPASEPRTRESGPDRSLSRTK